MNKKELFVISDSGDNKTKNRKFSAQENLESDPLVLQAKSMIKELFKNAKNANTPLSEVQQDFYNQGKKIREEFPENYHRYALYEVLVGGGVQQAVGSGLIDFPGEYSILEYLKNKLGYKENLGELRNAA